MTYPRVLPAPVGPIMRSLLLRPVTQVSLLWVTSSASIRAFAGSGLLVLGYFIVEAMFKSFLFWVLLLFAAYSDCLCDLIGQPEFDRLFCCEICVLRSYLEDLIDGLAGMLGKYLGYRLTGAH